MPFGELGFHADQAVAISKLSVIVRILCFGKECRRSTFELHPRNRNSKDLLRPLDKKHVDARWYSFLCW